MILSDLMKKLQVYLNDHGGDIEVRISSYLNDPTHEIVELESPIIDTASDALDGQNTIVFYDDDPSEKYPPSYRKVITLHYE